MIFLFSRLDSQRNRLDTIYQLCWWSILPLLYISLSKHVLILPFGGVGNMSHQTCIMESHIWTLMNDDDDEVLETQFSNQHYYYSIIHLLIITFLSHTLSDQQIQGPPQEYNFMSIICLYMSVLINWFMHLRIYIFDWWDYVYIVILL